MAPPPERRPSLPAENRREVHAADKVSRSVGTRSSAMVIITLLGLSFWCSAKSGEPTSGCQRQSTPDGPSARCRSAASGRRPATRVSGRPSSRRTMLAPCAIDDDLKNAMSRLPPWRPKPQSLETISCSGLMCSSARRMRAATSSGRSTCSVRWLTTPTAIFFGSRPFSGSEELDLPELPVGHLDGPDVPLERLRDTDRTTPCSCRPRSPAACSGLPQQV